jgi:hypothetical protein
MSQKWIHCNFLPPDPAAVDIPCDDSGMATLHDPCSQCGSEELCDCAATVRLEAAHEPPSSNLNWRGVPYAPEPEGD